MREQVKTLVIDDYPSSEYPFAPVENYILVDPSVRPLTQETYEGLLDYAGDGIELGSNLVSYIAPSRGECVYCPDIAGIYKEKPDFQAL